MSCSCEAAEAGASSLASPKRMLLGVLALLLISAVVVGVVLKLQSPQVPSGRVKGPALAHLVTKSPVPDNEQACYDRGRINSGFAALLCKAHRGRFSHMSRTRRSP